MKTKDLVIIAMYGVVISISTQIKIPIGMVPMTLQVFTITLGALTLTRKQILGALGMFIIISFLGIMPTASSVSGPQIFASPTFPYIIGFFVLAYILNKYKNLKGFLIAYPAFYLTALSILYIYLRFIYIVDPTITTVIATGFLPFVLTDLISIKLAFIASKRIKLNTN